MNITFKSTDFNTPDSTANLWYDVDGDEYAVSFSAWNDDQSREWDCSICILGCDGQPINDKDVKYVEMSKTLRERAISQLADELSTDEISRINAEKLVGRPG